MRKSFLSVRWVTRDQKFNHVNEQKTRSNKSEQLHHARNSVEVAWTDEQKLAVTSNGRNINHEDEIKKTSSERIVLPVKKKP